MEGCKAAMTKMLHFLLSNIEVDGPHRRPKEQSRDLLDGITPSNMKGPDTDAGAQ